MSLFGLTIAKNAQIAPDWSKIGRNWGFGCGKMVKSVEIGPQMVKLASFKRKSG